MERLSNTICLTNVKLVIIIGIVIISTQTTSGSTGPSVVSTSPVAQVTEDGILSIHCVFSNLVLRNHTVIIARDVGGYSHRLTLNDVLLDQIDERVFLAVRQIEGGAFVYFLTIISASKFDSGTYSCQILDTKDLSEIVRDSVIIDVHYFPTSVSCKQPHTSIYYADEPITFNCTTEMSDPVTSIHWVNSASKEMMPSFQKINQHGDVYSEFTFRPSIADTGAVFFCTILSPLFPFEKLSCHVGPLSVSPNPSGVKEGGPTELVTVSSTSSPNTINDVKDTSKIAMQCKDRCSLTMARYWITGTVLCSFAALVFLITCLILLMRISQLSTAENANDTLYSSGQLPDDLYAQLGNRLETGARLYMTLERPSKGDKNANHGSSHPEKDSPYIVPDVAPCSNL